MSADTVARRCTSSTVVARVGAGFDERLIHVARARRDLQRRTRSTIDPVELGRAARCRRLSVQLRKDETDYACGAGQARDNGNRGGTRTSKVRLPDRLTTA